MVQIELVESLENLIGPVVTSLGYELWGIEITGPDSNRLLQIYIDLVDKTTGKYITLDDCVKVSRQISALLDVEDVVLDRYVLEVSSPGLERPLLKRDHYERFINSSVRIKLRTAVKGQRNIIGVIESVVNDNIVIVFDGKSTVLPLGGIVRASLLSNS